MRQFLLMSGLMSYVCLVLRHNKTLVQTDVGVFIQCSRCLKVGGPGNGLPMFGNRL